MKKIVVLLIYFFAITFCYKNYTADLETEVNNTGKNIANIVGRCSHCSLEDTVWLFCDVIVLMYSFYGIYSVFLRQDRLRELKKKQEYDFLVARQQLIDSLKKNANGAIGIWGIPQECEPVLCEFILLPGGEEESKKIIESFQKYYYSKGSQEIA